jgi:hypothetical protein
MLAGILCSHGEVSGRQVHKGYWVIYEKENFGGLIFKEPGRP